jgi:hypothetical protein
MTVQTEQRQLTEDEKALHKEYSQGLKLRGFTKMDSEGSNQTRLFNRFNGKILPFSFIENDFNHWLHKHEKQCEQRSTSYITRTLPHVVGTKFCPKSGPFYEEPLTGCTWVNTYRAYEPATEDADVPPLFLEFFARLAPSDSERHTFLQWLAHIFQKPEERPSWHIMLPSVPGTGKGYLVEHILQPLLHHTSVVASYSRVLGKHSSLLENNLLVLLDDCKAKSVETQTELKSLLTEERQFVEQKYAAGGMVQCFTRFILASNEARPLYLDPDERRWYVLTRAVHRESLQETQQFIASLDAWLKLPGSLDRVFNFFSTYPLAGFNHKSVPVSDGLREVIALSKNPHAAFLADYLVENKVFTYADLVSAISQEGLSKPNDLHLGHLLTEAGMGRSRPRINGNQVSLYHPVGMTLEEIRAAYKEPAF